MSAFQDAIKISAKSREDVRKYIAVASETRGKESQKIENENKLAKSLNLDADALKLLKETFGVSASKSEAMRDARQAFRFARVHLRAALLDEKFSDVGENDSRTVDQFLSMAREICELTEKLNVNVK